MWRRRWPSVSDCAWPRTQLGHHLDPSIHPRTKSHPAPRHGKQGAFRSAPMPLQDGHSFQSESLVALESVPLQRSPSIVLPQRRWMRVGLYPALPHSVQDVTGTGRFNDMSAPSRTERLKRLLLERHCRRIRISNCSCLVSRARTLLGLPLLQVKS
jgi:hypothetical protein